MNSDMNLNEVITMIYDTYDKNTRMDAYVSPFSFLVRLNRGNTITDLHSIVSKSGYNLIKSKREGLINLSDSRNISLLKKSASLTNVLVDDLNRILIAGESIELHIKVSDLQLFHFIQKHKEESDFSDWVKIFFREIKECPKRRTEIDEEEYNTSVRLLKKCNVLD